MVRIWCLPTELLDKKHLVAEHFELHCIFNVLTKKLKGFSKHPQTLRFKNKEGMLLDRHSQQIKEFKKRRYHHNSPLYTWIKSEPYIYSSKEYCCDWLDLSYKYKKKTT